MTGSYEDPYETAAAHRTRLDRRTVERRQAAQRRRRRVVLLLLLATASLTGVDFAMGGINTPDPRDVTAQPGQHYIHPSAAQPTTPSSSPSPSPSPSSSRRPTIPYRGPGTFRTAAGGSEVMGRSGTLMRYRVRVERGTGQDPQEFAEWVDSTLGDRRSWIAGGNYRFQRVASGSYDFTVYLSTPATTDRLCAPLPTNGYTSCRQGDNVVVNLVRWMRGVSHWDSDMETYRRYVINHEVGHRLGKGHVRCTGQGDPAPVMQQQTLKLAGCTGNAWPYVNGRYLTGPPGGYA